MASEGTDQRARAEFIAELNGEEMGPHSIAAVNGGLPPGESFPLHPASYQGLGHEENLLFSQVTNILHTIYGPPAEPAYTAQFAEAATPDNAKPIGTTFDMKLDV